MCYTDDSLLSTGIDGLDEVLKGGLIPGRFYLLRGGPGTGKTTLGLHFLSAGIKNSQQSLLVSMTEPVKKIIQNGEKFGFDLEQIDFIDLNPGAEFIGDNKDYDVFPASEIEQKPIINKLIKTIKEKKPERIFFDGITQLKYLASDKFNFRKQILSFMKFLEDYKTTLLLTSEVGPSNSDDDLQFLVDGIINLKYENEDYSLEISKFRGSNFKKGKHSLKFRARGIEIYSRLNVSYHKLDHTDIQISSGIPEIDQLLHGGIEKGTTTTITGPSGVGKTTLGAQFIKAASSKGNRSIIYTFEEGEQTLIKRSKSINIDLEKSIAHNNLMIKKINPLEYTTNEFSYKVRQEIEKNNVSMVMLDSITGYFLAFSSFEKQKMLKRLHALCEYLKHKNVTVIMINEIENITGDFRATDYGASYLADNIIFLRYLEIKGRLNKAIGVLKKRMSSFENTMREFDIESSGIKVGEPLEQLRGVLSGNPEILED
ncbi:MAG: ATPase domain-containing protein [Bacillota bacterium]